MKTFDPKLVNKVRPSSTETALTFENTNKIKTNEHFTITFRQACGTFSVLVFKIFCAVGALCMFSYFELSSCN